MTEFKKEAKKTAAELLKYINSAVSPYHAVEGAVKEFETAGFEKLDIREKWNLKKGGKYYVKPYGTTVFAFTVGKKTGNDTDIHLAAAHTDFPCLHVKPAAEYASGDYLRVNTEVYGGPILNTWLDRPLSLAGRAALKGKDIYSPKMVLVDVKKPVLSIPNLAVHMNREVNKGVELKKQTDMIPLLGMISDKLNKDSYFIDFLAKQLKVKTEEILDFDLYVYNAEEGCLTGMDEEFIQSPRLDNLTSCFALVKAITTNEREKGINFAALYDNEEIGSNTKQGADSAILTMVFEKIFASLGMDKCGLNEAIMRSFLFSVDVAHAIHPNHREKYDPVNYSYMNEGVTLKINSNQRYTFDTEAVAIAGELCRKAGVKYKKFVNNSDIAGGGTLGPIISSWLPMLTVDVGVPLLAMHSARETMGIEDQVHLNNMMSAFYSDLK